MEAKLKAKELVESMAFGCKECDYEAKAKQCALIAVDELIKYHDDIMDVVRYELPSNIVAVIPYKYWEEVKQEILAL